MVAVHVYDGDERVVEYTNDDLLAEAERIYEEALHRYDPIVLVDVEGNVVDEPLLDYDPSDAYEQQILAWKEADGITYDGLELRRVHLIEAALRRGDITALAILGVGGRRLA